MNGVPVEPWIVQEIIKEVDAWPVLHSHASIESAIDDYRLLLFRNRELEEQMARLRGACHKLQGEKKDLLEKLSEMHADAQARREAVELKARLTESTAQNAKLEKDLSDYHRKLGNVTEKRDRLQDFCNSQSTQIADLKQQLEALELDRSDLQECLEMEKAARMAATEELQERLEAKELAERKAELLQAENYQYESRLLQMTEKHAEQMDAVRKEFDFLQDMKKQLEAEKAAAAESSSGEKPVKRPPPGFQIVGFMGNIVQGVKQHVSKMGEARSKDTEESVQSTPRTSDATLPPENAIAAVYPDKVLRRHEKVHSGGIACTGVAFSFSGMNAATCGTEGVVRVWGTHDGNLTTELCGPSQHRAAVNDVCFTLEGEAVLAATTDKSVKLWDVRTGHVKHTLTGHTAAVTSVTQHPFSHKMAASCGDDRCIKVWALDTGFCQRSILCSSKPHSLTFTADGSWLVSGHFDGAVRIWDPSNGSQVQEIKNVHTQPVVAVSPTPLSHRVVGCGRDSVLSVIDVTRFQVVKRFHDVLNFQVGQSKCSPCVSPDGQIIAVGALSGVVLLLDMKTGAIHDKLKAHNAAVTCVAWNSRAEDCAVCTASVDKAGDVVFWKSSQSRVNSLNVES